MSTHRSTDYQDGFNTANERADERIAALEAERDAALNAIRNTVEALDAQGACQTMADALRILIGRVEATGSIIGEWPPKPVRQADTIIGSLSGRPTARSDFRYTD